MTDTRRLPTPVAENWEWQLQGACRSVATERFFFPTNERGAARARRSQRAKLICNTCPVLQQCREHALRTAEPYGIWGGLDEHERLAVLRNKPNAVAS